MNTILNEENQDFSDEIAIDELFEHRENEKQLQIEIFRKILARIHNKIKLTSKLKTNNTFCFFLIPSVFFGCPLYNTKECTSYIIEKLIKNGFQINYTHPNLLFISWKHYIPHYQREVIKEKTGMVIDGFGNVKKNSNNNKSLVSTNKIEPNKKLTLKLDDKETYNDIKNYKPTGIYDESILKMFEKNS
jgi:hypothetical protein